MSVFHGKWIDDETTGEFENFDGFCDAMGITADGKEMYKNARMAIEYIVEGDTWTCDLTIGDSAHAYSLRIGVTNPEDVDIEGNGIIITPTLEQPNKLVEMTDTWLPSGKKVTTRMERIVAEDTMKCAITHLESGQTMKFNMTRVTS